MLKKILTKKIFIKINKKIVSALLGILLNFTLLIPVSNVKAANNKLNSQMTENIVSSNSNKNLKSNSKKLVRFSQKRNRKNKQMYEQELRIRLLKKYHILNREFDKLNPSLSLPKNNSRLKTAILHRSISEKQAKTNFQLKNQRNFSIRSGVTLDKSNDPKNKNTAGSNISSTVLKIRINKLIKKFEFVVDWINNNPMLFSLGLIANVSLLYLYKNGYFIEFYSLIKNSSRCFLGSTQQFSQLFDGDNSLTLSERVRKIDRSYFTRENARIYSDKLLHYCLYDDPDVIGSEIELSSSDTFSVEQSEQSIVKYSPREVFKEPTIEDYVQGWYERIAESSKDTESKEN
jgi:hypothetical protein